MIEIPALHDPDVNKFIERVVDYVRDKALDVNVLIQDRKATTTEGLSKEYFPFTTEAVIALKSKTQLLTPREITLQMTLCFGARTPSRSTGDHVGMRGLGGVNARRDTGRTVPACTHVCCSARIGGG